MDRAASAGQASSTEHRLFFKVEALQKTGSFKFRGALNAIQHLIEQKRATASDQGEPEAVSFCTSTSVDV